MRGPGRRTPDDNVSGRAHGRGTDRVVNDSGTGTCESGSPSQNHPAQPSFEAREGKGDAAARVEHGKHPDHDGCISGRQDSANARGVGERLREVDAREFHMDMKNPYSPAIRYFRGQLTDRQNTNSQVPDSREYNEAITAVADCAKKLLENFPRERSRLLALLSCELGWRRPWSTDDEDWTRSVT